MSSGYSLSVFEIEQKLREIATVIRRKGRVLLEGHGVTPPQFDALLVLNRKGPLTIGELGTHLYLAYSTTTDLVDRLERASLATRERDQTDRRVVHVSLLPAGVQLIEDVLDARRAYLAQALAALDDGSCQQVLQALDLLHLHIVDG